MGTRGAYGFRLDGQDKVTACRFDAYPAALGRAMAEFVRDTPLPRLRRVAKRLVLVPGHDWPISAQRHACRPVIELGRRHGLDYPHWPSWDRLLFEVEGHPACWPDGCVVHRFNPHAPTLSVDIALPGGVCYLADYHTLLADSFRCEWAYIVNLDDGLLEFYHGPNLDPRAPGRYTALGMPDRPGVSLIGEMAIVALQRTGIPSDLLHAAILARLATGHDGDQRYAEDHRANMHAWHTRDGRLLGCYNHQGTTLWAILEFALVAHDLPLFPGIHVSGRPAQTTVLLSDEY